MLITLKPEIRNGNGNSMKLFLVTMAAIITCGCTTFRYEIVEPAQATDQLSELDKTEFQIKQPLNYVLVSRGIRHNHFYFTNNASVPIYVKYEQSAGFALGKASIRLISGQTRSIHANLAVPDTIILPGKFSEVSFYPVDMAPLVDEFDIAIQKEGDTKIDRLVIKSAQKSLSGKSQEVKIEASNWKKYICYATAVFYGGYCWFISPDSDDDNGALTKAKEITKKENISVKYMGRE